MVSVLDFYAAYFLFFELGHGFDTHLVQPFLFVCKVCFYCWNMFFSISTETFMPVDIRHCHHWNKASYLYSITDATTICHHLSIARKRKLMIKCFTLDDEVREPIKPVRATRSQLLKPFQSDTSVVGLCVLCYSVFPIFRFGLKLFYFRYSKNTALNE